MISYAIVDIKGMQFKLIQNKYVYVPRISIKKEEKIFLDKVSLFVVDEKKIFIGTPYLKNIIVHIKILEHLKGKKIIIFKKKRRKGYKKKNGFRSLLSKIQVISFVEKNKKNGT